MRSPSASAACVSCEDAAVRFISSTGDLYFYVPVGTREFGVRIFGEGEKEAVGAAVFDPDEAKVWEVPTITTPEQCVGVPDPAHTGKAWRLGLAKPIGKTMEDFYVHLQGIPPLLSPSPEGLPRPAGSGEGE